MSEKVGGMKKFHFVIKPVFTQTVEAKTREEAVEVLKESIREYPLEVDDAIDDEIELEDWEWA